MVGKIHATDRDPQDTLTYSLAGEEGVGRASQWGQPMARSLPPYALPGADTFNATASAGGNLSPPWLAPMSTCAHGARGSAADHVDGASTSSPRRSW